LTALRAVQAGETFISPTLADKWANLQHRPNTDDPIEALSSRERQVLQLVASGQSNLLIAERLRISVYCGSASPQHHGQAGREELRPDDQICGGARRDLAAYSFSKATWDAIQHVWTDPDATIFHFCIIDFLASALTYPHRAH